MVVAGNFMCIDFMLEGEHENVFVDALHLHGIDWFPSFGGDIFDVVETSGF